VSEVAPSTEGCALATHVYAATGVYPVTVLVLDENGDTAQDRFEYVVVYDPAGGFVTGGGWIYSPIGASLVEPSAQGKASFGFVARYKKGATVPDGNTEFQFKSAALHFKSTSYQWLVISGARAQYKGWGAINGEGDYGFLLTAIDGQIPGGGGTDRFRIKIWDPVTSLILYDNQRETDDTAALSTSTVLQGGSIVIHKP